MHIKRSIQTTFIVVFIALSLGACEQPAPVAPTGEISQQELSERLSDNNAPLILDVRTADEYAAGHLPGAVNIPHGEVADRVSELPVDTADEIVIHCQSGKRASLAQTDLEAMGFSNIRPLEGHWAGWTEAGLPIE